MNSRLMLACGWVSCAMAGAAPGIPIPAVNDPGLRLQLFAAEPNIVTPTGIAVDERGRVLVIESHTHFPKKDYGGPKTDLVKVLVDGDGDGDFDELSIFADGFTAAMSLALSPSGELYLVHRNGVVILRDRDGDGKCEERKTIVEMETRGNYPHNGLGGIAFARDGWLYLGTGENLGERYTLKGRDGSSHSGGGEGGNVFRCKPDGSQLEHVATGFWNAFALEFNSAGHLFVVDNDPDSRPPCRLIDVVPGGDYGYRFRFGRSGLHPFTAWNGELPGTLPMVAGTGEAPSGILDTDRAALPARYRGGLLVSSWGDHRLEFYRPVGEGASVRANREVIAQGQEMFRPVALAAARDGSIYCTDWVDADYSVHGKGRIWKLSAKDGGGSRRPKPPVMKPSAARRRMLELLAMDSQKQFEELREALRDDDPFIRSAAVTVLAKPAFAGAARGFLASKNARERLGGLLALRRGKATNAAAILERALVDPDHDVRLAAVIWAGEGPADGHWPALAKTLSAGPVSTALLRAHAAAVERMGKAAAGAVIPKLGGVKGGSTELAPPKLGGVEGGSTELAPPKGRATQEIVLFAVTNGNQRLSPFPRFPEREKAPSRPSSDAEWRKALAQAGNPESGRLLFFNPTVGCAQCHRVEDYGGQLGPDLSVIGRVANRERIIDSILEPSKEIAPQWVQHTVEAKNGETYSGILTGQQADGTVTLLMNDGRAVMVPGGQARHHETSKVSLMPDGLEEGLSVQEFRDLVAYMMSLK